MISVKEFPSLDTLVVIGEENLKVRRATRLLDHVQKLREVGDEADLLNYLRANIQLRTAAVAELMGLTVERVRELIGEEIIPARGVRLGEGRFAYVVALGDVLDAWDAATAYMAKKKTRSGPDPEIRARKEAEQRAELTRIQEEFLTVEPVVPGPFVPDRGQLEAVEAIRTQDTFLVAPTGYGKSWVAYEAARETLENGSFVYYTTPLKALSNQKYSDLQECLGTENVGILTGDRQENPDARVLVMTTEILRNMVAEGRPIAPENGTCLIILDECHWLADEDRGSVWEELILFAPLNARLLFLSASIGNSSELTSWIARSRGREPRLVSVTKRPVPQRWGFVDRVYGILPLDIAERAAVRLKGPPDFPNLVKLLKARSLTPALIFLPTRRNCDEIAAHCRADSACEGIVIQAHHAGQLLSSRMKIERQLREGTVDIVFCTTTLASGIDAPVKTVVLTSFVDGRRQPIPRTTLQQMAGRAGRRGRDAVGFVLGWIAGDELGAFSRLSQSSPDPVHSAFVPTYQTTLLLTTRFGPEGARDFAARSFSRQMREDRIIAKVESIRSHEEQIQQLWNSITRRLCDDPRSTWSAYLEVRDELKKK